MTLSLFLSSDAVTDLPTPNEYERALEEGLGTEIDFVPASEALTGN